MPDGELHGFARACQLGFALARDSARRTLGGCGTSSRRGAAAPGRHHSLLLSRQYAVLSSLSSAGVICKVDIALVKANSSCLSIAAAGALLPLSSLSFAAVSVSQLATALLLLSSLNCLQPLLQLPTEYGLLLRPLLYKFLLFSLLCRSLVHPVGGCGLLNESFLPGP